MSVDSQLTTLGKFTSPFGVKGWIKLLSYTTPREKIFEYSEWTLVRQGQTEIRKLIKGQVQGKYLVAQIDGCGDRDKALEFRDVTIALPKDQLPALEAGEYYWHQLEGLRVQNVDGADLGRVKHLMETGSKDVLVIKPDKESVDSEERMVPYVWDVYVKNVDLELGRIEVDWRLDY